MTRYIQFQTDDADNFSILVEVDQQEVIPPPGLVKAGIQKNLEGAIAMAQTTFAAAIKGVIQHNVQAFIEAVHSLPEPPTEVEITFGLKATGEMGNVAIGKTGGEVNYTVKLAWKQVPKA
jgi:hypothetical protein